MTRHCWAKYPARRRQKNYLSVKIQTRRCLGPSQIVPCAPSQGATIASFPCELQFAKSEMSMSCLAVDNAPLHASCAAKRWTKFLAASHLNLRASRRAMRAQSAEPVHFCNRSIGDGKVATPVRAYVASTACRHVLPFTNTSRTVNFAAVCVTFSVGNDMTDYYRSPST
jgi:hypothetical protein